MSLDFHPKDEDILCSCDAENEIRFWSVSQGICTRTFHVSLSTYQNPLSILFVSMLKEYPTVNV